MRQSEFETRILELWVGTRVPFTRVNLQVATGVPRKKLEKWLDELVAAGTLEVDSDDDGELIWTVLGAERSRTGTTSVTDVRKLDTLKASIGGGASQALVRRAATAALLTGRGGPGRSDEKSLVAAGALSFFFGPLGWLYAAPLKDALPAVAVMMLAMTLIPHIFLIPLLGIAMPLSALAGVFYAWQHNSTGQRVSLRDIGRDR